MLSSLMSARAGAAVAGIVLGLGATAAVASSASRPSTAPSQGAPVGSSPSPSSSGKPSEHGVGPDATGPAAFGLCRAWTSSHKHDDGKPRAEGSVAMRNLVAAAGGEDRVEAYCAAVPHPGHGPEAAPGAERKGEGKVGKGAQGKEEGMAGRSGKDKPPKDKHPKGGPSQAEPKAKPSQAGPKHAPAPSAEPSSPSPTPSVSPSST